MRARGGGEKWPAAILWGLLTALCAFVAPLVLLLATAACGAAALRTARRARDRSTAELLGPVRLG
ncbi:hypothetical protein OG599_19750 [Streptomyces sp. NBC_01335]|uniref:hypothetical protein n=1 Tax=Streptomyces sp. NBC_01335 TaxID=2903828 RepID=UPI002E12AEC1|nr:hypothetical protein OG599_19750 [Streptomyces sp. NBC_01335]